MAINSVRLLNSAIQAINLGARFLFIFFLAKYLDPSLVGYYGIFAAAVSYTLYFVGLDYYIYVSREILKKSTEERGRLLKGQVALSAIMYLVLTPFAIFFLLNSGWPGHLVWWFFPILILEHFNQEMSRLLIVLSEPIRATVILFIRQGSWSVVMIAAMILDPDARSLELVMGLWTTAGLLAAFLAIWRLRQLGTSGWGKPVDWAWVKKGIVLSLAFLIGTLALRGVQTFDRYWLERLAGIEAVGAYVLLFGIASTLIIFLESALFSFSCPVLIKLSHEGEYRQAQKTVNRLFLQTVSIALIFGLTSWLALPYLLLWIGSEVYINSMNLYPWLLVAITMNAVSMVPHYALYARGTDKPIIYSHLVSIVIFLAVTWFFSKTNPTFAVPIGLNSAFAVILIWKTAAYLIEVSKNSHPSNYSRK